ncbi:helix-turn-helix domain-containing protein [Ruania zhangjianzhongii]|uniref:helix-turn-helix domain-containing protein n=1 Tax=Ruania zhangjianzhongii TaxID=2603206 RepID=UPI0011CC54C3|nr:helix-turn-helix domain-containing protein [Ruania zhangjianzhongii]
MIDRAVGLSGKPVSVMSRKDRIEVLRNLEERGAFHIKRAVDQVAARLGVSRVTVYADLDIVRNGGRTTT